ncbi:hypothetical protein TTRE_0000511101 [Trichuris trichiura]|uniref:Uncharacterized protein n=1 Tax=Trichuris trichiura TaxID=36087 RepID=A0A077ZAJ2_TRITR|nr:hypothetical protein TTRE_0000511101 [Trichuris trichiura]
MEERMLKEFIEPIGKAKKKKCRTQPLNGDALEGKRTKTKKKKKIVALSPDCGAERVLVEGEKLVSQRVDREDQGVITNLPEENKGRKREAAATDENGTAAAELISLRKWSSEADVGIAQSAVEVNLPDNIACRITNHDEQE